MKRFLVFLLVVVGPVIGFGQTLRTTINAGILSQGNKGITATKLNNVLVTVADSVSSKANKSGGVFSGSITAPSFVRAGGTSLQFLKADGSVDASAFAILGNNNVFTGTAKFNSTFNVGTIQSSSTASTNSNYSNRFNNIVFSRSDIPTTFTNVISNSWSGTNTDQTMNFEVANGASTRLTAMTLSGNGNVGIGVTAPVSKLHISGSGDNTIKINSTASNNPYFNLTLQNTGTTPIGVLSAGDGVAFRSIVINPDGGNVLLGTTTNQGYKLDVNGTLRTVNDAYFATTSGNVGVGTTIPGAKLHVSGSSLFETVLGGQTYIPFTDGKNYIRGIEHFFANATGGGDFMTIKASGNVGIATVAPAQKLDVNGTAQATQFKLSALNTAPASATATGVVGEIRIDASYIYICTATNTWKRSALTTW